MTQVEKRQKWASQVASFKASDLSAAAWCAAHDVKAHQLYYWINKFISEDEPAVKETQWLSMEVGGLDTSHQTEVLNIKVGKATIEVSPGFNPSLLSEVIRTLVVL